MEFTAGDTVITPSLGKCTVIDVFKGSAGSNFVKLKNVKSNEECVRYADKLSKDIRTKGYEKFNHPVLFNAPREAYWFTIGFITRHGEIELRTTPKTHDVVMREYFDVTNDWADEDYIIYNPNEDTFTDNACITFNRPEDKIYDTLYFPENSKGKRVSELSKNKCKVYNKSFIWTLLSFGFRTGVDHDIDEIKIHLGRQPLEYIKAFNKGYHGKI